MEINKLVGQEIGVRYYTYNARWDFSYNQEDSTEEETLHVVARPLERDIILRHTTVVLTQE